MNIEPSQAMRGAAHDPTSMTRANQHRGQTAFCVAGISGFGPETARQARAEGTDVVLTGGRPDRLEQASH